MTSIFFNSIDPNTATEKILNTEQTIQPDVEAETEPNPNGLVGSVFDQSSELFRNIASPLEVSSNEDCDQNTGIGCTKNISF